MDLAWADHHLHSIRIAVDPEHGGAGNVTLHIGEDQFVLADLGVGVLPGDSHRKTLLQTVYLPSGVSGDVVWRFQGTGAMQVADGIIMDPF